MRKVAGFIIRSSAFVTKELVEIFRQTRLLLVLVLGPFLILLLFGIGYRNEARTLRAVFVVPGDSPTIVNEVKQQASTLGPQLAVFGVTSDENKAMQELSRGQVDVVVVIPTDIEQKIRDSQQPVFQMYHREIDPNQVNYVAYVAQIYVDELNRRVLENVAQEGQQEAAGIQGQLGVAKSSARVMHDAFQAGQPEQAKAASVLMGQALDTISLSVGASLGLLQGVEQTMGPNSEEGTVSQILTTLDALQADSQALENVDPGLTDYSREAQRSAEIQQNLDTLDTQLADFRRIDPQVLVSPFQAEAHSITNLKLTTSDFLSPGVIILLLQHLSVTFAALSIVRERRSGAMELFRVAPISSIETLIGKYLSYLFLGALLSAGISALVVLVLHVPMIGSWENYALVLLAVLFASLGAGFVISLLSETTSQAVQYSMLLLLFSIFFSGFFLDLRLMWDKMRFLSYLIPATYGMRLLQETMFRGGLFNLALMAGLVAIGLVLFVISWMLLRRQMKLY